MKYLFDRIFSTIQIPKTSHKSRSGLMNLIQISIVGEIHKSRQPQITRGTSVPILGHRSPENIPDVHVEHDFVGIRHRKVSVALRTQCVKRVRGGCDSKWWPGQVRTGDLLVQNVVHNWSKTTILDLSSHLVTPSHAC